MTMWTAPVCHALATAVSFLYTQYCRTPLNLSDRYGRGSWAVVSGASDGIGLGFSVELAKRGFNICLLARSEIKLRKAVAEVEAARPGAKTRIGTLPADVLCSVLPCLYLLAQCLDNTSTLHVLCNAQSR